MSSPIAPAFDFCKIQRFINHIGGAPGFPSHAKAAAQFHDDRLAQYGFEFWSDMVPHIASADHWKWLEHPPLPGVYAISVIACDFDGSIRTPKGAEHLMYIGSAKNISVRLGQRNHWYQHLARRFHNWDTAVVVRVLLTADFVWAERSLIRTLRPLLNIHHNNAT